MTRGQTNMVYDVQEKLKECRESLDNVMYYSEPISEEEHKRLRSCYDKICQATDAL